MVRTRRGARSPARVAKPAPPRVEAPRPPSPPPESTRTADVEANAWEEKFSFIDTATQWDERVWILMFSAFTLGLIAIGMCVTVEGPVATTPAPPPPPSPLSWLTFASQTVEKHFPSLPVLSLVSSL
jgi:hypothetical protein